MSTIIERAEDFLARNIKASAGVASVFSRSGIADIPITVSYGRRMMEIHQGQGSVLTANVRTAIVTSADLGTVIPKPGDKLATSTEKWIVGLPGLRAAFEYVGTTQTMMRLFLRKDDEEESAG